ncbi:MAG: hypothetical protein HXY22_06570 [Alphaproteobacteria bacterium]|nr:hypothetical protein [Alphaproteobacteria bacterium]
MSAIAWIVLFLGVVSILWIGAAHIVALINDEAIARRFGKRKRCAFDD